MSGITPNSGPGPLQTVKDTTASTAPTPNLVMRLLSMGCSASVPDMAANTRASHEGATAHHGSAATFARTTPPPDPPVSGVSDKTQIDVTKQALKLGVSGTMGSLASAATGLLGHTLLFARANPEFVRDVGREMQPTMLDAQDPFGGVASIGLAENSGIGPRYELPAETREDLTRAYFSGAKHDLVATAKLTTGTGAFKDFLRTALPNSPGLAEKIATKATPALTGAGWLLRGADAVQAYDTLKAQYALPSDKRDTETVIKAAQSLAVNTVVPMADIATKLGMAGSTATPIAVLSVLALGEAGAFYYRDPENLSRLGAEMANPLNAAALFD